MRPLSIVLAIAATLLGMTGAAMIADPADANAATVTLGKAGRSLGDVKLVSMVVVSSPHRGARLRHIGATAQGLGCWASPRLHEASYCVVTQNCRHGGCWLKNTLGWQGVRIRVHYRRRA
jgi:hypothetical protein